MQICMISSSKFLCIFITCTSVLELNSVNVYEIYDPCCDKTSLRGFLIWADANRVVVSPKMTSRWLEILYLGVEELYYLCNENKVADELCDYSKADLGLCFCICKKAVFS